MKWPFGILLCLTANAEQAYFIRWEGNSWDISRSGRDWQRRTIVAERAQRSDGATFDKSTDSEGALFGTKSVSTTESIYLPPSTRVTIDRIRRTLVFYSMPAQPRAESPIVVDRNVSACSNQRSGPHVFYRYLGTDTVRGIPVESFGNGSGLDFEEVALAPSLGCQILRHYSIRTKAVNVSHVNLFRLPMSRFHMEAVKVQLGEPPPELFQLPADYQRTQGGTAILMPR